MNTYSAIKHISLDDFRKIDINRILYVQLDTGEIVLYSEDEQDNIDSQEE